MKHHNVLHILLTFTLLLVVCVLLLTACSGETSQETPSKPATDSKPTDSHVHQWSDWSLTAEPTCTKEGEESRSCECGETEKRAVAERHNFTASATSSDNGDSLHVTYTCECGKTYKEDVVPTDCMVMQENREFIGFTGEENENLVIPAFFQNDGTWYRVIGIDNFAFRESALATVTIPNSVTSIGDNAFDGCSNLTSVTLPDCVTSIGDYAFAYCNFTSITLPGNVTYIGNGAFVGCVNLTSITIPTSITSIGEKVFYNCRSLTNLTIPYGITSIGNEAFKYCDGLVSVTIPSSVTNIGDEAFAYCTAIQTFTYEGTLAQWSAMTRGAYWNAMACYDGIICSDGIASINGSEPTEPTEPTERPKPEIQVMTIEEYMTMKYGEYAFVRSEPWFEMFRIKNGTVSVFVYKHEELKYGVNLAGVYDYMFTYNWADNGYWQVNADKIEDYYDELMKPYLKDIGDYALFAYLEQAVMPSGLTLDMSWENALKEYGEFLFPEITIMVKTPLTDAHKAKIVDKLTADGVKVRLHIGTAPAEDFELHRNSVIPYIVEKYSNQMDVRINWNGDIPTEEVPQVDGN